MEFGVHKINRKVIRLDGDAVNKARKEDVIGNLKQVLENVKENEGYCHCKTFNTLATWTLNHLFSKDPYSLNHFNPCLTERMNLHGESIL